MEVTKCPHCKKAFFITNSEICPYCGKNIKIDLNIFGNYKNPFKDIFDCFGGSIDEKN
jgi:endogenous inhibitor of DNA gyrase (YacG/DUF329 family)